MLIACTLVMLFLFLYDFVGIIAEALGSRVVRHIDFKSAIVSIGIFGTFVGILAGLYGFDSTHIAESVPQLLEGLKFAFITSVFGMFFSVVLAILQKLFLEAGEESAVLHSIERNIIKLYGRVDKLSATIESPAVLVKEFSEMKVFLAAQLQQINGSLDKALVELASGASKEIIQALEDVIVEFNTNLQEQFGDNFKQLNEACAKLLEWQDKYRDHVDSAESHLKEIRASLETSSTAAQSLVSSSKATKEVCESVSDLMRTYDVQIATLATHLESCKRLGDEAKVFLESTHEALNSSTENLSSFSGLIEKSVSLQSKALTELTQDIQDQLPKALGELEDVLTKLTAQFARDYRSLFEFVTAKNE